MIKVKTIAILKLANVFLQNEFLTLHITNINYALLIYCLYIFLKSDHPGL